VAQGNGTHFFSRTLREHNEAVRIYQLRRVARAEPPDKTSTEAPLETQETSSN
jgi:UPF0755 protein